MNNIEESVKKIVDSIVLGTALRLVRVEYVREDKEWFLRVFITKEGGVEIDDCVLVSKQLSKKLDEEDFIKTQYYLEVSSPGIDDAPSEAGGKID